MTCIPGLSALGLSVCLKDGPKLVISAPAEFVDAIDDILKSAIVILGMYLTNSYILSSGGASIAGMSDYMKMMFVPVVLGMVAYNVVGRKLIVVMPRSGSESFYLAHKRFR
jgi:hypothetical protein